MLASISFEMNGSMGEYVLYASAVLHDAGLFNFADLEGIVSEYVAEDCQGLAFGVVASYRGVASIIAPFTFGLMFTELSDTSISFMFIAVGMFMGVLEIALSVFPLKRLLNKMQPQSVRLDTRVSEDVQDDGDTIASPNATHIPLVHLGEDEEVRYQIRTVLLRVTYHQYRNSLPAPYSLSLRHSDIVSQ